MDEERSSDEERSLPRFMSRGVREFPRNASWLLAKALDPIGAAKKSAQSAVTEGSESAKESVTDSARAAAIKARDVMPGADSVEQRLQRARAAADRAGSAEEDAVAAAQTAKQDAEEVKAAQEAEKAQLRKVKQEQDQRLKDLTADARARADDQVDREVESAQAEAERTLTSGR